MNRQKWIYNLAFLLAAPLLLSSCGSTQRASGEASTAAVSSATAAASEAASLEGTESSAEEATEVSEASSAQSTEAPSSDSTEASSGETTEAASEETTEAASAESTAASSDEDSAQLTEYLQYIEDNFCSDSYAGISIRAAGCAAEMMAWYTDAKPADEEVTDTVKAYVDALPESDRSAFSQGVTMVYESAQDISGKNGKELLEDAGYTGDITWTSQDADALFHAIFAGLDAS